MENKIIIGVFRRLDNRFDGLDDNSDQALDLHNLRKKALRLMEMDVLNNRPSIGIAADKIGLAHDSSIKIIQKYFEPGEETKKSNTAI